MYCRTNSPATRRKMSPHRRESDHEGPGEARQYSAGVSGGREACSGVQSGLQSPGDLRGILDLGIVAEVLEAGDGSARPQGDQGVQDGLGRDRIEHPPGNRERFLPFADGAMPALGMLEALLHVGDRLVAQRAPTSGADQLPLVLGLVVCERMIGREDRAELLAEESLAR